MVNTFIPVKTPKKQGLTLESTRGLKHAEGDIGIEIEVEGKRLPCVSMSIQDYKEGAPFKKFWLYHPDGSLRGEENGEYVLVKPIKFDQVPEALEALWRLFEACKTKLDDSNRTSTHVHLNVQQFHTNRLTSLMALYIIFEEVLTAWCGDHRVGNLFCLRAKDAPGMLHAIKALINLDFAGGISDQLHYSGMNVNALNKYGSLEFRSLRGTQDVETILQWCNVLRRLYDLSADFKDPREICYLFSGNGPVAFFENILGDCAPYIRSGVPMSETEIRQSMYEGIRLAQDICYCRDWSLFEEVKLSKDPFGRPQKKVMQGLQYYAMTDVDQPQYQEPYDAAMDNHGGGFHPAPIPMPTLQAPPGWGNEPAGLTVGQHAQQILNQWSPPPAPTAPTTNPFEAFLDVAHEEGPDFNDDF